MEVPVFPSAYWDAWSANASFVPGEILPPESQGHLWAVLAFIFYGDKVLLAQIRERGVCIPSGHIEPGESLDEALEREVYEETGAVLSASRRRLLGCYILKPKDAQSGGNKYCPVFVGEADSFGPIPANSESEGMFLAAVEDVADLYFFWDQLLAAVFAYAQDKRDEWFPVGVNLNTFTQGTG